MSVIYCHQKIYFQNKSVKFIYAKSSSMQNQQIFPIKQKTIHLLKFCIFLTTKFDHRNQIPIKNLSFNCTSIHFKNCFTIHSAFTKCKVTNKVQNNSGLRSEDTGAQQHYIRKTPNFVDSTGALSEALMLSPRTSLVSTGSIMPSSQSL